MEHPTRRNPALGALAGAGAFTIWGVVAIYWKLLKHVPAWEILAHRFLWSFVFVFVLVAVQRRWKELRAVTRSRRTLALCACSGVLIATNWGLFIWAVNAGFILETSLGYFMNPLLNVLLGTVFFRERLNFLQWLAVAIAAGGVFYSVANYGAVPWVALGLCSTFGAYAVLRKIAKVESISGLFLETTVLLPIAILALAWLALHGQNTIHLTDGKMLLLISLSGVITGIPLILFAVAARSLKLTTVGILQYLAPSLSFLIGVGLYGEAFTLARKVTFGCTWTALVLFNLGIFLDVKRRGSKAAPETPAPIE